MLFCVTSDSEKGKTFKSSYYKQFFEAKKIKKLFEIYA